MESVLKKLDNLLEIQKDWFKKNFAKKPLKKPAKLFYTDFVCICAVFPSFCLKPGNFNIKPVYMDHSLEFPVFAKITGKAFLY